MTASAFDAGPLDEPVASGFRHVAFPYAGADDFVARATPVIARAVDAREPVLVAVDAAKIQRLRDGLGSASKAVIWKDVRHFGRNPARITHAWRQFVARWAGSGRLWGFGEQVWAGRTPAELIEVRRHERLLSLVFADDPPLTLLCPYDTETLGPDELREAHRSHPPAGDVVAVRFDEPLPAPPGEPPELLLDGVPMAGVRTFASDRVAVDGALADDMALAIAAVAESMRRRAKPGRLRVWREPASVVAEIRGLAPVDDPLAGWEWPPPSGGPSRGLWLANLLSDLVQVRSGPRGAVVRMHFGATEGPPAGERG
jgi:hypothetical protein